MIPAIALLALQSGGLLRPEQAAYDVRHYDLALEVDPSAHAIDGRLTVRAAVVHPLHELWLDLDDALEVSGASEGGQARAFVREPGLVRVDLERTRQPGEELTVSVAYGGVPREASNPPWSGGFTWAQTADGSPWIATSCQGEGADLWWPCKDHPSDEPDSMDLHVTVPAGLVVASNGRLAGVDEDGGRRTYHWSVSTPINNYGVALAIAPYVTASTWYESVTGEKVPVTFWALPEDDAAARAFLPEILRQLRFFEELLGPYPFRADKYGVAETPFLGMEHQTLIAYGYGFPEDPRGYDWLHHHELAHEWLGNLATAYDWRDFWLHEGFATYTQSLYTERLFGRQAYLDAMREMRSLLNNERPIVPHRGAETGEAYFSDSQSHDNDVYYKGAWVLHTLRFVIGDEALFGAMRRLVYTSPEAERTTDGSACHFVATRDFVRLAEAGAGVDLGWLFEVYLHHAELPELAMRREGDTLQLEWHAPEGLPFPMPVEVEVDGQRQRVELPEGRARLPVPAGAEVAIDPDGWILRAE